MKHLVKVAWIILCCIFSSFFLLAAGSQFIPSSVFSPVVFFSIGFPYLFAAMLLMATISIFIYKKLGIAMFLLLGAGVYNLTYTVAVNPGSRWSNTKPPHALRILTWNVADFIDAHPLHTPKGSTRRKMLQMISAYNPDVMCLQEYTNVEGSRRLVSVKHELDSMGYKYILQSNDMTVTNPYATFIRGVALCSKTPFLDTGHVALQNYWHPETMLYADLPFKGKKIRIATGHLFSFFLFPDSAYGYDGQRKVLKKLYYYKNDIQRKMRDIERMHQEQAAAIDSALQQSPYPAVFCGDMNAVPTSYTYRILKNNRRDAFLEKGNGIGATFYKMAPTLRIDYCFTDKALHIAQCRVSDKKLSDHYALITDVVWSDN